MRTYHLGRRAFAATVLLMSLWVADSARAEKPDTVELLPDETLVFVRIPSIPALIEGFQESSTGQIMEDDRIRPLFEELYDLAAGEFEQLEDQVGLSLDEIMELPQGEVSFALVDQDGELAVAVFFEAGESIESAQVLLDRGEELAESDGGSGSTETIGDMDLRVVTGDDGETVCYFVLDGVICMTNNRYLSEDILTRWAGQSVEDERTFDTNRKYVTIMNRCRTVDDEEAHFQFFVDPIEIVRVQAQQSVAGRAGFAFIPTIGLDGMLGVGGTMTMGTENYESVIHLHALISNPRDGVMNMIAMKPGDTTPEDWVPYNAVSFNTINWDFGQTYDEVEKLVDGFRGEGWLGDQIEDNFNANVGINFYEDVLDNLEGRITYVQWLEEPVRINSQTILLGMKLNDPDAFQDTIDDFLATVDGQGRVTEEKYEGVVYFKTPGGGPGARNRRFNPDTGEVEEFEPEEPPFEFRQQTPCFGIVGDYLLISDSEEAFKSAVRASEDPEESLRSDPDFDIVNDEIKKLVGTNYPGAVFYTRPAESFRFLFDLAGSDDMLNTLDRGAEDVEALGRLRDVIADNPLPDFEEFEEMMPPSGGVMINDETGLHLTFFSLRRDN